MDQALAHITMVGRSNRGKQIIQELGRSWSIAITRQRVLFSDDDGPWHFVFPEDHQGEARWVHAFNDKKFVISSH